MLDAAFAPPPAYKTPSPPQVLTNAPPAISHLSRLLQDLLISQLLQFGLHPNGESLPPPPLGDQPSYPELVCVVSIGVGRVLVGLGTLGGGLGT